MMRKKGGTHIEVIISFMIFVGFLLFFYFIMEPAIKGPRSDDTLLQDVEAKMLESLSAEVTEYELTFQEDENGISDCIKMAGIFNYNVTIKGDGEPIGYYQYETETINDVEYDRTYFIINNYGELEDGLSIYESKEIAEPFSTPSCTVEPMSPCGEANCYNDRVFIKKRDYIFQSKINESQENYENNKDILRDLWDIPSKYEFWFDFLGEDGETSIFGEAWEDPSVDIESENIYVDKFAISYVDEVNQDPENKKQGSLEIRIWG